MKKLFTSLLFLGMIAPFGASAQLQLKNEAPANPDNAPAPVHPVPSDRQLLWNETEFYAFFHYGMNTFTGSEWGYGNEAESRYAPLAVPNPEQWVTAVKAAGMNGGIAVVKHTTASACGQQLQQSTVSRKLVMRMVATQISLNSLLMQAVNII